MSISQAVLIDSTELTQEQISALIEQIGGQLPQGWDRRRHRRLKDRRIAVLINVKGDGDGTSLFVLAQNLSCGGLGFRHVAPLPLGTPVQVKVVLMRDEPLRVTGSVTRCHALSSTSFEIGIKFDGEIQSEELADHLGPEPDEGGGRREVGNQSPSFHSETRRSIDEDHSRQADRRTGKD